jgi:hypothetical protein
VSSRLILPKVKRNEIPTDKGVVLSTTFAVVVRLSDAEGIVMFCGCDVLYGNNGFEAFGDMLFNP